MQNNTQSAPLNGLDTQSLGPYLSFRVITPELAKQDKSALTPIKVSANSTVRQVHEAVADHLHLPHAFEKPGLQNECNCNLARQLSNGASLPDKVVVVHGKSIVKHLDISGPATETRISTAVNIAVNETFGESAAAKKITHHGGEHHAANSASTPVTYKRIPVVAICSKSRHVPAHAVVNYGNANEPQSRVLDLHTSEMPISPACMDLKVSELGLEALAVNGAIDLYAVKRNTTSTGPTTGHGKGAIFRYQPHWEPNVKQSDRGLAMFLSSLRVFASLVQDMAGDEPLQDAIYHIFDILSGFAPALRTLHILVQGKTPTAVDSAALAHGVFEVLAGFMPVEIIGTSRARVFEGSRLLFGFILEKARSAKLTDPRAEGKTLPYLSSFESLNIQDAKTSEGVMHLTTTSQGQVETALHDAMEEGGALRDTHLQSFLVTVESDPRVVRAALLSGGAAPEATSFSLAKLTSNYQYEDSGVATAAFDTTELAELHHLAELCGRHKLTVHKPSQLVSAVAPCLTFDREGHVAVYTGQLPCSNPGKSSQVFRPKHGEEAIDEAVVEQLLAPITRAHEADGTAVFDLLGGAAVRRLQSPDEIVMFAVDCSSSMRMATDFADVNDEDSIIDPGPPVSSVIDGHHYNQLTFEEMKEEFSARESFNDMVAIVAEASSPRRQFVACKVLELLRITIGADIMEKHADLETRRTRVFCITSDYALSSLQSSLDKKKAFWAGLRTHETALCDFLIFRATTSSDLGTSWMWSFGHEVPSGCGPSRRLSSLPDELTEIPNHLMCPISHNLMESAVKAVDGFTYSRQAISQWFAIRPTSPISPMTGLELTSTDIVAHEATSNVVASWINGHDILARQSPGSSTVKLTFESVNGSFDREVPTSMTINDLYRVVFRGLKARAMVFQLAIGDKPVPPSDTSIELTGLQCQKRVLVRIADDTNMRAYSGASSNTVSGEMCLVKVYSDTETLVCSYWVRRDTTKTLESILWKYWRVCFMYDQLPVITEQAVWTNMSSSGDGLMRGSCNSTTDNLSTYLNRGHCFGKLSTEPVYRDQSGFPLDAHSPLVLKVFISEPANKTERMDAGKLSRLDVLKQMFEALINRTLAYGYKSHMGLVTFDATARVASGITHVLENLRRATNDMDADGDTALWDALALCRDQLKQYAIKYPDAKRRIIVISDGDDTKSTANRPYDLAWACRQDRIAIDSVLIGEEENTELMALSHMLGCYKFQPTSLPNALAICEMEPFLSVTERPDIHPPGTFPLSPYVQGHFLSSMLVAEPTTVNADNFPVRKAHPNMGDDVIQLSAFAMQQPRTAASGSGSARSNLRTTRLLNEMRSIVTSGGHSSVDIYISESDMSFWKIVMAGPEDSPYSEGTFLLYLHMEENYPTFAPQCRMITKIKHPNINPHGRICHSLFGRDWTSDTSMRTVIDTIYGLLLQAEVSDPVNTAAALGYHHDQVEYADEVREYVETHALKSREEWKEELLGLTESHDD